MRQGDGWFDTAYHKIDKPTISTGYLQKYIKEQNTDKYILITSQNIADYIFFRLSLDSLYNLKKL